MAQKPKPLLPRKMEKQLADAKKRKDAGILTPDEISWEPFYSGNSITLDDYHSS